MRKLFLAAALGSAAFSVAPASAAELITNGNFETGSFAGWLVSGAGTSGVYNNGGTGVPASMGTFRAGFSGATVTLYQDIATVIGATYTFGFIDELDPGSSTNSFTASFGSNNVFTRTNVASSPGFTPNSYSVTATSATTRVSFTFATAGAFQNFDNVTVTGPAAAVPEPATWAMMIGGFGFIGAALRRRRKIAVSFG